VNFSAIRAQARRAVHDTLAAPATYQHTETGAEYPVSVRHRGKVEAVGTSGSSFAQLLATQDFIIFDADELTALDLELRVNGIVSIDIGGTTLVFVLEAAEPSTGPVDRPWRATQKKQPRK